MEGKTTAGIREQLDQDYKSTMLANWGVFVPAAVVNLAFCPPELRVLFLNVRERETRAAWPYTFEPCACCSLGFACCGTYVTVYAAMFGKLKIDTTKRLLTKNMVLELLSSYPVPVSI